MLLQAIPPTWKAIDSGAWTVEKSGALLFTFAKGLGKAGRPKPGEARFDWQNKQVLISFALLVVLALSSLA